jgi:hypothetical protein
MSWVCFDLLNNHLGFCSTNLQDSCDTWYPVYTVKTDHKIIRCVRLGRLGRRILRMLYLWLQYMSDLNSGPFQERVRTNTTNIAWQSSDEAGGCGTETILLSALSDSASSSATTTSQAILLSYSPRHAGNVRCKNPHFLNMGFIGWVLYCIHSMVSEVAMQHVT